MSFMRMLFRVQDTSGFFLARCIRPLKGRFKKRLHLGIIIVVSPQKRKALRKELKVKVTYGMICGLNFWFRRAAGYFIICSENLLFLLRDLQNALSTKVKGPMFYELFFFFGFEVRLMFKFYV